MSMLIPTLLALLLPALCLGALLGLAAHRFRRSDNPVAEQINDILPQTQCAQCGYAGCRPYAEAIAEGDAINKCPPGGEHTILALANLLDLEPVPLDPAFGKTEAPRVAVIREAECIGCTFCIQACPVDAIVGAAQQMHTVIQAECTGCELCVTPCPVDCIDMVTLPSLPSPVLPTKSLSEQACIRCGLCVEACPVDLLPQQLFWFCQGEDFDKALDHRLLDCIECGLCHAVCPSHIPLVQYYQFAKATVQQKQHSQQQAAYSRKRYDTRQARLQLEQARQEQRRSRRSELASSNHSEQIQSALERARARQLQQQDKS